MYKCNTIFMHESKCILYKNTYTRSMHLEQQLNMDMLKGYFWMYPSLYGFPLSNWNLVIWTTWLWNNHI